MGAQELYRRLTPNTVTVMTSLQSQKRLTRVTYMRGGAAAAAATLSVTTSCVKSPAAGDRSTLVLCAMQVQPLPDSLSSGACSRRAGNWLWHSGIVQLLQLPAYLSPPAERSSLQQSRRAGHSRRAMKDLAAVAAARYLSLSAKYILQQQGNGKVASLCNAAAEGCLLACLQQMLHFTQLVGTNNFLTM